jgi:hypothetical protein
MEAVESFAVLQVLRKTETARQHFFEICVWDTHHVTVLIDDQPAITRQ